MKIKTTVGTLVAIGIIVTSGWKIYPQIAYKQDEVATNIENQFVETENKGIYKNRQVEVPIDLLKSSIEGRVLGESEEIGKEKKIEVDLSRQKLYAIEDGQIIYEYLISSGTWNRTPTGVFKIWTKIKSQKMSGGSKELGTYYYLPNVPSILFFYNENVPKQLGYSIHGAYWHNQFGRPMSHGCINMTIEESKVIFDWADMDTPIEIYGKMPVIQLPRAEN